MAANSARSDRVILFTLVDLLTQIIFLALFLVVLFQQSNEQLSAQLQQKLIPYQIIASSELADFLNAVSKLVPLADIDKTRSLGDRGQKAVRDRLKALSSLLKRMNSDHVRASDLVRLLNQQKGLSQIDQATLSDLLALTASMTASQRGKLLEAARTIERPRCFGGDFAFSVEEVGEGYIVSKPIRAISGPYQSAVMPYERRGNGYLVPLSDFGTFGQHLGATFKNCDIRVNESSVTNSEFQYKRLGQYFWLGPR